MQELTTIARPVSHLLVAALLLLGIQVPAARAAIVGTDKLLQAPQRSADRERIKALLARQDVRAELLARGVDPRVVQARVDGLTDDEAGTLAARMDRMPAGGDVLGLAVFVFLVLLFTDIMGYTDIFPFVTKHAR